MNNYTVTKSFQDKNTGELYEVGSSYEVTDNNRAAELENNGFISRQANQAGAKANTEAAAKAEAKTVVNGKVVSLKAAQQAEKAAAEQRNQTGITEAQNNKTEAVNAGQKAKNASQAAARTEQLNVKNVNVQSGQKELEQHMQGGQGLDIKTQVSSEESLKSEQAAAKTTTNKKAKNQAGE
jgi:hypothetical protein